MAAPSYCETEQLIQVDLSDEVDLAAVAGLRTAVIALAVEHDCYRVLVDASRSSLELPLDEIFHQATETREALDAEGLAPFQLKRAVVVAPGNRDAKFYEDVAVTRGHAFQIFLSVDEAKAWLRGAPAPDGRSTRTP